MQRRPRTESKSSHQDQAERLREREENEAPLPKCVADSPVALPTPKVDSGDDDDCRMLWERLRGICTRTAATQTDKQTEGVARTAEKKGGAQ